MVASRMSRRVRAGAASSRRSITARAPGWVSVVCTLCADPHQRRGVVLRASRDAGTTWSAPVVLDAGAAAYSVCVPLADGVLGLAWEAGDYDEIVFARITLEELGLTGGTPTLVARAGRAGAAKPPEVAG